MFRPWFGRSIAKYILEERKHTWGGGEPLVIVEVGGGTGSLAASILVRPRPGGGGFCEPVRVWLLRRALHRSKVPRGFQVMPLLHQV